MNQSVNPVELRARIDSYYMAMTGARTPFKALRWYAARTGTGMRTLRAWCSGERNPFKPSMLLLEYQERYDVGSECLKEARSRRDDYHRERNA